MKEGIIMNNMSFIKGMGLGLIAGSVAVMVVTPKKKKMNVGKTLRSVGDAIDSVAGSIGL